MNILPNRVEKWALSSSWSLLFPLETSPKLHHFFLDRWVHQFAHYRVKRDGRNSAAMPIIEGISVFQVDGIYLCIFLQYLPTPWVHITCFDISRSRNGVQTGLQSA